VPTRLFKIFQGPHWTLLGYEVDRVTAVRPRGGLRIHTFGAFGDIIDEGGHIRDGYGLKPGNWVLIRPDGYIGAIVSSDERPALARYLEHVGLGTAVDRETQ
jgi:hypothetical protein